MKNEFYVLPDREKDRRYKLIRDEMQKRHLSCLIVTGYSSRWNDMNANVRYISNYADILSTASYVVFPLEGESTYIIQMGLKRAQATLCWIKDVRPMSTIRAPEIFAERINALGLQEGNIGLVGASYRDGEVIGMPYNVYEDLTRKFPKAKFVDVTNMFTEFRTLKSRDELKCIEESVRICDIAFLEMVKAAKPGIQERAWFGRIHNAVYANGGEPPTFLIGMSGPMPARKNMYTTDGYGQYLSLFKNDCLYSSRTMNKGDVIISEVGPTVAGYVAQSLQMISLGRPHKNLRSVADHTVSIFKDTAKQLKPGRTVGEVVAFGERLAKEAEQELGGFETAMNPIIHLSGIANVEPTVEPLRELELKPGMALMLEIGPDAGTKSPVYAWIGSCFEITNTGSKSLTKIPYSELALTTV